MSINNSYMTDGRELETERNLDRSIPINHPSNTARNHYDMQPAFMQSLHNRHGNANPQYHDMQPTQMRSLPIGHGNSTAYKFTGQEQNLSEFGSANSLQGWPASTHRGRDTSPQTGTIYNEHRTGSHRAQPESYATYDLRLARQDSLTNRPYLPQFGESDRPRQPGHEKQPLQKAGHAQPRRPKKTVKEPPPSKVRKNGQRKRKASQSIAPHDSVSNTGPNTKRQKTKPKPEEKPDFPCAACGAQNHNLDRHPYPDTAEGFVVGCIMHNTYSHSTDNCKTFNALDAWDQATLVVMKRPLMAPVWLGNRTTLTILTAARNPRPFPYDFGPYSPRFASRLADEDIFNDPGIQAQIQTEHRMINDLTTAKGRARLKDLGDWSSTQLREPLTATGAYETMTMDDWPVMNSIWMSAQLERLMHAMKHRRPHEQGMDHGPEVNPRHPPHPSYSHNVTYARPVSRISESDHGHLHSPIWHRVPDSYHGPRQGSTFMDGHSMQSIKEEREAPQYPYEDEADLRLSDNSDRY